MPICWGCERLAIPVAFGLLTSCTGNPSSQPIPPPASILLVTFPSLRPDVTGRYGRSDSATPHYDHFARQADWAGSAISASSAPVVALRSLMTGTSPWQHQTLTQSSFDRPRHPATLSRKLGEQGFVSHALVPASANLERYLLADGFDTIDRSDERPTARLVELLAQPATAPIFVWVHLPEPDLPWRGQHGSTQPHQQQVAVRDLLLYADPAIELPQALRARFRTLYEAQVRTADAILGEVLATIKSQQRRQFVTAVSASVGFELGEQSQVMFGQNLGRASLEVPLAIELSPTLRETFSFRENRSRPVGQTRLWATLAKIAGTKTPPRVAPSLLRKAGGSNGSDVVSELYLRNGENLFSLVAKDHQLVWHHRYASPSGDFYRTQIELASGGARAAAREQLAIDHRQFVRRQPLSGHLRHRDGARLELFRWTPDGRSEPLEDSFLSLSMARQLRHKFLLFSEIERAPDAESRWSKVSSQGRFAADLK